jgi:hypothetical protein
MDLISRSNSKWLVPRPRGAVENTEIDLMRRRAAALGTCQL